MATVNEAFAATEPCRWPAFETFEEKLRDAQQRVRMARHGAEDAVAEAVLTIRRHPLRAVGAGAVIGAGVGALVGFAAGWFARTRG
jgi:ElaB/YqjD/DUF883 family membrane-anchored ribosome-binding protein